MWIALLAGSALAVEPVFKSPLETHATHSALALKAPLNALATAGRRLVTAGQRGHILYSDDGTTWQQADVPVSSDLTALAFPTPQQGWAVGHEGVVLHTADGGASWTTQLDGLRVAERLVQQYDKPRNAEDPDAQRLQQDAESFAAQGADKPFLDVWFEDERHGFVIGAFNLILHTDDGGRNWTPWLDRVDNPKSLHLYSIRPAGGTLFIAGEQGIVLKLERARERFVRVPLPYEGTLFGVTGNASATIVFGLRGNAYRSTDAGAHWDRITTGVAAGLTGGAVCGDGSIVLVSQAGQVLLSRDDGVSFSRVRTEVAAPAFAVTDLGDGAIALAGLGGVRREAVETHAP
jgi:photosystem II stability/assembly factor-like uncharacterized protein